MIYKLKAVYRAGAFVPQDALFLPDETEVELTVEPAQLVPAHVQNAEERRRRMQILVNRMQQNPIPPDAPKFTREQLHERR